eukprot:3635918-Amphidinium_carterae.1
MRCFPEFRGRLFKRAGDPLRSEVNRFATQYSWLREERVEHSTSIKAATAQQMLWKGMRK